MGLVYMYMLMTAIFISLHARWWDERRKKTNILSWWHQKLDEWEELKTYYFREAYAKIISDLKWSIAYIYAEMFILFIRYV